MKEREMLRESMKQLITVNELVQVLSSLPEEAGSMCVCNICGCVDTYAGKKVPGFQFRLADENLNSHYILVPQDRNDVMYDSFGKRTVESGAGR